MSITKKEYDLLVFAPDSFTALGPHADRRTLRGLATRHLVRTRKITHPQVVLEWRITVDGKTAIAEYQRAHDIMPRLAL